MTKTAKRKRGRPVGSKSANPANKTLPPIRVTDERLQAYKAASESNGMSLSAWVKGLLDKAVNQRKA